MEPSAPRTCHRHGRTASFLNPLNGELLCDYDELLYRRSPRHGELVPLSTIASDPTAAGDGAAARSDTEQT